MIDLDRFRVLGKQGVDLFLCESTNVERGGFTPSESDVGIKLAKVFEENFEKRIFVATFSSNIFRVQQLVELAMLYKRKVVLLGRSIFNNIESAQQVGAFNFARGLFITQDEAKDYYDDQLLFICTGSQGEPTSALSRLASGEMNDVQLGENDLVIVSSSPIPGNEKMINEIINRLCRLGADVICEDVHASGHACEEELKVLHGLVHPRNFIPVHGEYRHLLKHIHLAESVGMSPQQTALVEIGDVIKLTDSGMQKVSSVTAGEMLVDGNGVGRKNSMVVKERLQLSEDGIAIITILYSPDLKKMISRPVIVTRGLVYTDEQAELHEDLQKIVTEAMEQVALKTPFDTEEAKNMVRRPVRLYFNKKMGRMPIILPIFNILSGDQIKETSSRPLVQKKNASAFIATQMRYAEESAG